MKKYPMLWLLPVLLLALCGCGARETPRNIGPQDLPKLTVSTRGASTAATRGTCSWGLQMDGRPAPHVMIDSLHVLDSREYLTPLQLSAGGPAEGFLQFDRIPDEVQVLRWSEDCWGQPELPGEAVEVSLSAPGGAAPCWSLELMGGNYIYQIYARWNTYDPGGGSAYFGFCTQLT